MSFHISPNDPNSLALFPWEQYGAGWVSMVRFHYQKGFEMSPQSVLYHTTLRMP